MGSPKFIGYIVAAIMLAIFAVGTMRSLEGVKDGRLIQDLKDQNSMLERRAMDQERQVAENREELKLLEHKAGEAAKEKIQLEEMLKEKVELEEAITRSRAERTGNLELARAEKARLMAKARSMKYETLTASNGRVYNGVEVREATAEGLRISHTEGLATIAPANLPADLRTALGYDIELPVDEVADEEPAETEAAAPAPPAPVPPAPATATAPAPAKPASPANLKLSPENRMEVARIRAQIRLLESQADSFEAEAKVHEQRGADARLRGRPNSHDVEARRDRESARRIRHQILELERKVIELEYPK